jgi:uncharacterized protein (TIGR02145 family)
MKYTLSALTLLAVLMSSGYAQDTVRVKDGWNLIGSVNAGAILEVLSTVPDNIITSSFFGYTPGTGYQSKDTLGKGVGYWLKVKEDGVIIFSPSPTIDPCKSKAFIHQGKFYNTVKIGDQCWMAENLDVGLMIDSLQNAADNDTMEKYCYRNDPANCSLYGGLYQWSEAMQYVATPRTRGMCPAGWHIPTLAEFQTLSSSLGGDGNAVKAEGQGAGGGAGTNSSGFSALLAGYRDGSNDSFIYLGSFTHFWSSTEGGEASAFVLGLSSGAELIFLNYDTDETYGFSVRCLED